MHNELDDPQAPTLRETLQIVFGALATCAAFTLIGIWAA